MKIIEQRCPSSQTLLYIVITIGAIALVYMTNKDLIKKPGKQGGASDEGQQGGNAGASAAVLPLQLQAYERLVLLIRPHQPAKPELADLSAGVPQ